MSPPSVSALPRQCLEHIYDRLHVHDRLRLNAALPARERVTKTMRTCTAVDAKLAAACLAMKRIRRKGRAVPLRIVRFMEHHARDPTVVHLLESEDAVTRAAMSAAMSAAASRVTWTLDDRLKHIDVATEAELADVVAAMWAIATPEQFAEFVRHPKTRRLVVARDWYMFNVINHGNETLAAHLIACGAETYGLDIAAALHVVVSGTGNGLLTDPRCREMILRLLPTDPVVVETVIDSILDDLDADALARVAAASAVAIAVTLQ
jgi:hypothetical protein